MDRRTFLQLVSAGLSVAPLAQSLVTRLRSDEWQLVSLSFVAPVRGSPVCTALEDPPLDRSYPEGKKFRIYQFRHLTMPLTSWPRLLARFTKFAPLYRSDSMLGDWQILEDATLCFTHGPAVYDLLGMHEQYGQMICVPRTNFLVPR